MTAVLKTMKEKKAGFEIPTIEEVKLYMIEKKDWPEKFALYYAEKFWSFYQSNGWKVSGKAAMKDWQAAFTAQWQTPKFKDDIDFLNECKKNKPAIVKSMNENERLNAVLQKYKHNFESVPQETLVKVYDYLKERQMLKLNKDDVSVIKKAYANDPEKGKAACVKTLFDNMITYGKCF